MALKINKWLSRGVLKNTPIFLGEVMEKTRPYLELRFASTKAVLGKQNDKQTLPQMVVFNDDLPW